jgi:hypothetical protein
LVGGAVAVVVAGVGDELVGGDDAVAGGASVFDVPAGREQSEWCRWEFGDDRAVGGHGWVIALRVAWARARWLRRR